MRKSGMGLTLLASVPLTLLSSPALAEGTGPSAAAAPVKAARASKAATGWVILGIGGAVTVGGVVLDVVGATYGRAVPGAGGPGAGQTTTNARTNFLCAGTALVIAGLVTGVVGGSIVLHPNEDTNKKPEDRPSDDASNDAMGHAVAAALQAAPAAMVAIVGATF